jgi:hypothetical protein
MGGIVLLGALLMALTPAANTRRDLEQDRKHAGYSCRDYPLDTSLTFRCSRGVNVFFAIKR